MSNVEFVRQKVERALSQLAMNWVAGETTFTFIARNPLVAGREMIVTSDPDLKELAALLVEHAERPSPSVPAEGNVK